MKGELIIPDNVVNIGASAFEGCTGLTGNLLIPDNVVNIGEGAFKGCTGFDGELKLGGNLKMIAESAFYGCSNLIGNIVIPDAVESVSNYAFKGCKSLLLSGNTLKLGKGLKYIGERVFDIELDANAGASGCFFDKIYCAAPIPPSIDISSYLYGRILIVPIGCLNVYMDSNWTSMVTSSIGPNIIEEDF